MLNQMCDILAELQAQYKKVTLCKVPAHMGIKGNEAIDTPGVISTRLPYTDYYFPSGRQESPNSRGSGKTY